MNKFPPSPTPEEMQHWHRATHGAVPYGEPVSLPEIPSAEEPSPVAKPVQKPSLRPAANAPLPPLKAGDYSGIDKRTAQRFVRGKMPLDAMLDLHGCTLQQARTLLHEHIHTHHAQGKRRLLVITGKGGKEGRGAIRESLLFWLNESEIREKIIAIAPAQPKDGGPGAWYILLRRLRERKT